jgi:hypothetical protein
MNSKKVLILGCPRSGTSLLAGMLGSHPEVAMLWEDRSFAIKRLVGKRVAGNKLCVPNQIRRFAPWYERLFRRYGWFIYRDKSAISIEQHVSTPDMHFVLIVRDPDAVISSMMRRGELSRLDAVARWREGIHTLDELARNDEAQTAVVQFERLLHSPQVTMESVCTFLDLPFSDKMLEGHKHTKLYNQHDGIDASKAQSTSSDSNSELSNTEAKAFESYRRLRLQAEKLYT